MTNIPLCGIMTNLISRTAWRGVCDKAGRIILLPSIPGLSSRMLKNSTLIKGDVVKEIAKLKNQNAFLQGLKPGSEHKRLKIFMGVARREDKSYRYL